MAIIRERAKLTIFYVELIYSYRFVFVTVDRIIIVIRAGELVDWRNVWAPIYDRESTSGGCDSGRIFSNGRRKTDVVERRVRLFGPANVITALTNLLVWYFPAT